jgi:uncharacterized short protein YbdD (DUF466 family)
MKLQTRVRHGLRRLWDWVRAASGDDAYEHYLAHHGRLEGHGAPLSRRAFHAERQQRKWGGISRCC